PDRRRRLGRIRAELVTPPLSNVLTAQIAGPCGGALTRTSSRNGAVNDPASPTHDRGHASSEPRPLQQISLFARHFGKSPEILGPADIRAYQIHLSQEKRLSASSILVAVAAIRFLYKVTLRRGWSVDEIIPTCRKPQKLPVVLSQDEVARFLDAVDSRKHRAILTICYAAGLRISEAVRLTPAAIDSQRMVICVEEGKGRKDRYVMLSPRLLEVLRTYWRAVHPKNLLFPGDIPDQPISTLRRATRL